MKNQGGFFQRLPQKQSRGVWRFYYGQALRLRSFPFLILGRVDQNRFHALVPLPDSSALHDILELIIFIDRT